VNPLILVLVRNILAPNMFRDGTPFCRIVRQKAAATRRCDGASRCRRTVSERVGNDSLRNAIAGALGLGLLAFSTTENMGLITLALGAATLLSDTGSASAANVAMAAAMLHRIAHAAFKSLGILCAGSVLAATGLWDLDRLGGPARRMPVTTALFGVAALGASGLPLGAGFVSEWLLVQSLIHQGLTA
jgi:hypothetical protein